MRKAIQLFLDTAPIFQELSDEDAGRLLKASFAYHQGEAYKLPASIQSHFAWLKAQFDRDISDSKERSEKQRARALKRWGTPTVPPTPPPPLVPKKPCPLPETPPPAKGSGSYPNDAELVIAKAAERGYLMSMEEALRFLSDMKSMNWQIDGKPVRTWWKLLDGQKVRQSPDQRAAAIKESQRRKKGLPPVEEAKLDQWERYTDAQGRKWKRPLGSTDQDDWEQDGKQAVI